MRKIYLLFFVLASAFFSKAQTVDILTNLSASSFVVIGPSNYHVSEAIYTNEEIGATNFISPTNTIDKVNFFINTEGTPTLTTNFRIYMKNVPIGTTTLTTGAYSTAGYTLVYNGSYTATGVLAGVTLTTPFQRTANTNLQVLIERVDNVVHTGYAFYTANGNTVGGVSDPNVTSSRRYNNTTAPASGVTSLTASAFRPAIELIHTLPINAALAGIGTPDPSCYNTPQTIQVAIANDGSSNIAAGAAVAILKVRGANTYTASIANTGIIAPGGFEVIDFTGINLSNAGDNFDTAYVTLTGDTDHTNDTLSTVNTTSSILSSFPLVEDVEGSLPVFPYAVTIEFDQLWTLQNGAYSNTDQTTPLDPHSGDWAYLFDSYSGASSLGFESRLYSNCINMNALSASPVLTFWMSHDNLFPTDWDSLYVSVSTDRGLTWTRLSGYRRYDPAATTPLWRMETVNLNAYLGQVIMIGFEGVSKYGNAFMLDDITISGILPVSLMNFDARRTGSVNQLSWRTAQESNTQRFIVERSTDGGRTFNSIGQVAAAGNSSSIRSYQFIDASPVKGYNHYRLKTVDLDNSSRLSNIRVVNNSGMLEMTVIPNPVSDKLNLRIDADKAEQAILSISDLSGKQVFTMPVTVINGTNNIEANISKLQSGTYVATLKLSTQKLVSRLVKL